MKTRLEEIEEFMDHIEGTDAYKRFRTWHPDIETRIRDLLETGNPIVTEFMDEALAARRETAANQEERWITAFGLTPKETALAAALVRGATLPDHAAKTGKAYSTVKSQLLSLFRKTGASRQMELIEILRRN